MTDAPRGKHMVSGQPEGSADVRAMARRPGAGGPTALRIMLGAQLRRLREAKRITLEDAGYAIRASGSKMSRLETGRVSFKSRDIADLLTVYGVTDQQERAALQELARQASAMGWWHDYADIMPSWFEPYVGLEEAASSVRCYEIQLIPGLVQTADYARAITRLCHPGGSAAEIERRVSLRMGRQAVLSRQAAAHLWLVLEEAALHRPVGGPDVMRAQLRHLLSISARPNVTLQVIPLSKGGNVAAGGPFTILRFGAPELPDVVYIEQLTSALYLDKRETVDHYLAVMERLCVEALPAAGSLEMIRAILDRDQGGPAPPYLVERSLCSSGSGQARGCGSGQARGLSRPRPADGASRLPSGRRRPAGQRAGPGRRRAHGGARPVRCPGTWCGFPPARRR